MFVSEESVFGGGMRVLDSMSCGDRTHLLDSLIDRTPSFVWSSGLQWRADALGAAVDPRAHSRCDHKNPPLVFDQLPTIAAVSHSR